MSDHVQIRELRRPIKEFKRLLKATLNDNCAGWLYTLELHLLCHVVEELQRFWMPESCG